MREFRAPDIDPGQSSFWETAAAPGSVPHARLDRQSFGDAHQFLEGPPGRQQLRLAARLADQLNTHGSPSRVNPQGTDNTGQLVKVRAKVMVIQST